MNAVVIGVLVVIVLSLVRFNVVASLCLGAFAGGLVAGLDLSSTLDAFSAGLGGGASVALNYALLGAFAVSLERVGLPSLVAEYVLGKVNASAQAREKMARYAILALIAAIAVSSQNLVPVHIAFIPILIPPLLVVFNRLQLDRRAVACCLTFGLTVPYMVLPVGFGAIFLNDIVLANSVSNGLAGVEARDVPMAMLLPAIGMIAGVLLAVFWSYRRPKSYQDRELVGKIHGTETSKCSPWLMLVAVLLAFAVQLWTGTVLLAAFAGYFVLIAGGALKWQQSNTVFIEGMRLMAQIGFVMIAAAGFAAVMKATGHIDTMVAFASEHLLDQRGLAALVMLLVGLFITMGIGSSFSTVPIIAAVFVPLALELGFSPLAIIALIGTAGGLGDAGSPASDSTLGPSMGLAADGQHDHIWDTVVPTFLHFNLPLLLFGWIAIMTL